MRVVGVTTFGGPDALAVHEVQEPHAGPGQVRIRVQAFAVSPTDTLIRSGARDVGSAQPPYVPGMDAAGVIDEVGNGAVDVEGRDWAVGDRVMAIALPLTAHGGAYVEELVAPADSIARVPAGSTVEEASTLPMNALTAVQVLELLDLLPGQTLAVTGAAGMLGNYLVQLGEQGGLTVLADAADKDRVLVASLGADHIVPRGDDVADRFLAIVPDGVDGLADTALLHDAVVPAVRDAGGFVAVRGWIGGPIRDIRFAAASVSREYHAAAKLDRIRELVEQGKVTPRVADVLPASEAAEAHRRLEAGGVRGRIVLTW